MPKNSPIPKLPRKLDHHPIAQYKYIAFSHVFWNVALTITIWTSWHASPRLAKFERTNENKNWYVQDAEQQAQILLPPFRWKKHYIYGALLLLHVLTSLECFTSDGIEMEANKRSVTNRPVSILMKVHCLLCDTVSICMPLVSEWLYHVCGCTTEFIRYDQK